MPADYLSHAISRYDYASDFLLIIPHKSLNGYLQDVTFYDDVDAVIDKFLVIVNIWAMLQKLDPALYHCCHFAKTSICLYVQRLVYQLQFRSWM